MKIQQTTAVFPNVSDNRKRNGVFLGKAQVIRVKGSAQYPRTRSRQGFVLLAVLVFIMMISMVTVSLLFRSRAEETAANAGRGGEQAWAAAFSGVQEAMRLAALAKSGGDQWIDNPAALRERSVFEDGSDRWMFTVFSAGDSESQTEVRYGLVDEASRVNLNHPGGCDLGKIPRVTAAMVQALQRRMGQAPANPKSVSPPESTTGAGSLEELDALLELGSVQGEDMASSSWVPTPSTGPLASLEELLAVPGFTRELIFGEDANFNGRLDPNENDGDENPPADNRDGRLDHGMAQYFTVGTYDPNRTSTGSPRVDLNNPAESLPSADFPAAFTNYVAALRSAKIRLGHPADVLEATIKVTDPQGQEVEVASGITKEELPKILDLFTTDKASRREGLINVNTASAIVLATLPGLDLSQAETIVAARPSLRADKRTTPAWLLTEGLVDAPKFKQIAPFLTAQSYQFDFHVIGYALPSGQYRVLEVKIDMAETTPRITRIRDITRFGLPFNLLSNTLEQTTPGTAQSSPSLFSTPYRSHG